MIEIKRDKYKSARGGRSRLYAITCAKCNVHICVYQKDGPGLLKRMYLDRMDSNNLEAKDLLCPSCERLLGSYTIYKKENRPAYRLYIGSVNKTVASASIGV